MKKVLYFIKKNYIWLITLALLFIIFSITKKVMGQEIIKYDALAYDFFVVSLRNDYLTQVMKATTIFGGAIVLIGISIVSFVLIKNKRYAIYITCNLALSFVLSQIFKYIIQRPRPEGYRLIDESGFSYPSGHSMVSMAFYGLLIYLIYKHVKSKKVKIPSCILLALLIVVIGSSRIYLGVHYASDVIGGALISIVYLVIYTKVINRFFEKSFKDN